MDDIDIKKWGKDSYLGVKMTSKEYEELRRDGEIEEQIETTWKEDSAGIARKIEKPVAFYKGKEIVIWE